MRTWSFDITHRAVHRQGDARPSRHAWIFPREFCGSRRPLVVEEKVAAAPGFAYEDTAYRLSLKDFGFGLHKGVICIRGPEKGTIAEVPVVWDAFPFSAPCRIASRWSLDPSAFSFAARTTPSN